MARKATHDFFITLFLSQVPYWNLAFFQAAKVPTPSRKLVIFQRKVALCSSGAWHRVGMRSVDLFLMASMLKTTFLGCLEMTSFKGFKAFWDDF
ncbi:MAG: hypothetical protein ACYSTW_09130 [Planctomycetota bacterium]